GRTQQRVEHRLQVEGRAADDLEHVGGGGLLLQRFTQLVEQTEVLDGDDGLISEGFDEGNLSVIERFGLAARRGNRADDLTLPNHRSRNYRIISELACKLCSSGWGGGIANNWRDLNNLL